jgi:hypothetical protein
MKRTLVAASLLSASFCIERPAAAQATCTDNGACYNPQPVQQEICPGYTDWTLLEFGWNLNDSLVGEALCTAVGMPGTSDYNASITASGTTSANVSGCTGTGGGNGGGTINAQLCYLVGSGSVNWSADGTVTNCQTTMGGGSSSSGGSSGGSGGQCVCTSTMQSETLKKSGEYNFSLGARKSVDMMTMFGNWQRRLPRWFQGYLNDPFIQQCLKKSVSGWVQGAATGQITNKRNKISQGDANCDAGISASVCNDYSQNGGLGIQVSGQAQLTTKACFANYNVPPAVITGWAQVDIGARITNSSTSNDCQGTNGSCWSLSGQTTAQGGVSIRLFGYSYTQRGGVTCTLGAVWGNDCSGINPTPRCWTL